AGAGAASGCEAGVAITNGGRVTAGAGAAVGTGAPGAGAASAAGLVPVVPTVSRGGADCCANAADERARAVVNVVSTRAIIEEPLSHAPPHRAAESNGRAAARR